jgi:hypothetical protein
MSPAKRLRVLTAITLAWGAIVVTLSAGAAWAQTTETTTPASTPPPSTPVSSAPAAPAAATPELGPVSGRGDGKSWCDKGAARFLCAGGKFAEQLSEGDLVGAAGTAVSEVAAPVVGAATDNITSAITAWVAEGARGLLERLGGAVEATTTPHLDAGWFQTHYRAMVGLAGLLVFPFVLSSLLGAIVRQDFGRLIRTVFGYLPLAGILTAGAVSLVVGGLALTDSLSSWVGAGTGADAAAFLGNVSVKVAALSALPGAAPQFLVFLGGLILVAGAVAVWLELLIRSAAIYVAVLFLPLALAGMVWPATSHWSKRLTHLLIAVIVSKFVIVAILALAASGLAAAPSDGGGFGSVLAGGALLGLAAFSPMALLRMAPIVEANLAASVGGGRASSRVSQAAADKVMGKGRSLVEDAQAWNLRDKTTPPPATWRSFQTGSTTGSAGGTAGAATGGATVAADAGLKAVQAGARHANGLAHGAGSLPDTSSTSNGNGTSGGRSGGAGTGRQFPMGSSGEAAWPSSPGRGGGTHKPNADNGNGANGGDGDGHH